MEYYLLHKLGREWFPTIVYTFYGRTKLNGNKLVAIKLSLLLLLLLHNAEQHRAAVVVLGGWVSVGCQSIVLALIETYLFVRMDAIDMFPIVNQSFTMFVQHLHVNEWLGSNNANAADKL